MCNIKFGRQEHLCNLLRVLLSKSHQQIHLECWAGNKSSREESESGGNPDHHWVTRQDSSSKSEPTRKMSGSLSWFSEEYITWLLWKARGWPHIGFLHTSYDTLLFRTFIRAKSLFMIFTSLSLTSRWQPQIEECQQQEKEPLSSRQNFLELSNDSLEHRWQSKNAILLQVFHDKKQLQWIDKKFANIFQNHLKIDQNFNSCPFLAVPRFYRTLSKSHHRDLWPSRQNI